jgi:hypothetical protein
MKALIIAILFSSFVSSVQAAPIDPKWQVAPPTLMLSLGAPVSAGQLQQDAFDADVTAMTGSTDTGYNISYHGNPPATLFGDNTAPGFHLGPCLTSAELLVQVLQSSNTIDALFDMGICAHYNYMF